MHSGFNIYISFSFSIFYISRIKFPVILTPICLFIWWIAKLLFFFLYGVLFVYASNILFYRLYIQQQQQEKYQWTTHTTSNKWINKNLISFCCYIFIINIIIIRNFLNIPVIINTNIKSKYWSHEKKWTLWNLYLLWIMTDQNKRNNKRGQVNYKYN